MLVFVFLLCINFSRNKSETFTMGYLTGSQRRPGDQEYPRPGLTISGAISLAVAELNRGAIGKVEVICKKNVLFENCFVYIGELGHKLEFIVAETYGEEVTSVQQTADLWTKNVSVYIGPQETCEHEAFMAAAFNLPMISYVSILEIACHNWRT